MMFNSEQFYFFRITLQMLSDKLTSFHSFAIYSAVSNPIALLLGNRGADILH